MSTPRTDSTMRDLLPLILSLVVPLAICIVVMVVEPGLERRFLYAALTVAAILWVLGLALSFVVGRYAERGERR